MQRQNKLLYSVLTAGLMMSLLASCMDASMLDNTTEGTAPSTEEGTEERENSTQRPSNSNPLSEADLSNVSSDTTLFLSRDGFQLTQPSEDTEAVVFGESLVEATEAAVLALGEPTTVAQANDECPAGPMEFTSWDNGLTLNAMNGELVGWSLRSFNLVGTPPSTDKGVSVGQPRSELEAAYSVELVESTLGTEFVADSSLYGILSADAPDATVEYLWAGTSCNFR